jgi:phosphotransferase system enzyme I (PtsI)
VGIGRVLIYREPDLNFGHVVYLGLEKEKKRLKAAIARFKEEIAVLAAIAEKKSGPSQAAILTGQVAMISDPFMLSQIEELLAKGQVAEAAVAEVAQGYEDMFNGLDDEKTRQRATDIEDMKRRLLSILLGVERLELSTISDGVIVVALDLPASALTSLPMERVRALATERGGLTSHGSIMARALGVPAVTGLVGLMGQAYEDGDLIVVDGSGGEIIIEPTAEEVEDYERRRSVWKADQASLKFFLKKPALDADGVKRVLGANIGGLADARQAQEFGADGVGLFRTEFLFLDRASLPTEEEQTRVYAEVAGLFPDQEVIIRTLDIGGDKRIPSLGVTKEENPYLGLRGIRFCLARQDIFKSQLRALARAGAQRGNIKIMLPLVISVEEVTLTQKLLAEALAELSAEGLAHDARVKLGVMLETPAAALIVDLLAKVSDFFSVGSNDLTQYTLVADRGNPQVSHLCDPFHPAVLRNLNIVIAEAKKTQTPLGLCGEIGGDPWMLPLLLGFGLEKFSVSAPSLAAVRREMISWSVAEARELTEEVLTFTTAARVKAFLKEAVATKTKRTIR